MDWVAANVSWLNASGAVWALSGGVFLSRGLIMNDAAIKQRSGSYYGSSPPAVKGLCEQRIEARVGLAQILIGFVLQLLASLGVTLFFGWSLLTVLPIAFIWHYMARNFKYWVAVASLRFVQNAPEHVWRIHFSDVPDGIWESAVRRSGVTFKPLPPSES